MTRNSDQCFSCGATDLYPFYEVRNIPVHSCQLMRSAEEAQAIRRGDLGLAFCQSCGFIQNRLFDSDVHDYGARYEESQEFSPTFSKFAERLAHDLVQAYGLREKRVIEIGCGKGSFLVQICEAGHNSGIGIDPSYVSERLTSEAAERIDFIQDFYSEKYTHLEADMICCRHTLEHIQPTGHFVELVRKSMEGQDGTVAFFEVPDVLRVLQEQAFWDLYYEHCSYFSLGSLDRLFRARDFEVLSARTAFGDQYLLLDARAKNGHASGGGGPIDDMEVLRAAVETFEVECPKRLASWKQTFEDIKSRGQRAVLWGAGSKAVAFLTTLDIAEECGAVIDINPHKQGTFTPGTGHPILPPSFLREYKPDVVLVMNPIYKEEIGAELEAMDVEARLLTVP